MIHKPEEFEALYQQGGWDGKGSGPGSTEAFTRGFREVFQKLLVQKNIKSVFDLGCGDWSWQKYIDWGGILYEGWDISGTAIRASFKAALDNGYGLLCDPDWPPTREKDAFLEPIWPEADLLLVKDVVHHISPYRVRMLIDRAKYYNYVLWVVDIDDEKYYDAPMPINWHGQYPDWKWLTDFDTSIENYPYGPKAAFLQTNP